MEGRVSETGLDVWLKRPRRGPPLARARGRISNTSIGSRITIEVPRKRSLSAGALAFVLLGWMVSAALFLAHFLGAASFLWAPYVAGVFAILAGAGLIMSLSNAEATELERAIGALLDGLESPAASRDAAADPRLHPSNEAS